MPVPILPSAVDVTCAEQLFRLIPAELLAVSLCTPLPILCLPMARSLSLRHPPLIQLRRSVRQSPLSKQLSRSLFPRHQLPICPLGPLQILRRSSRLIPPPPAWTGLRLAKALRAVRLIRPTPRVVSSPLTQLRRLSLLAGS